MNNKTEYNGFLYDDNRKDWDFSFDTNQTVSRNELTEREIDLKLGLIRESEDVKEIMINSKYKHVSELPEDILSQFNNCIIDKGETGCGFTNFYLTNKDNVILIAPRVQVIKSKEEQSDDKALFIYGTRDVFDVKKYATKCIKNKMPIKIMSTYDAIFKVKDGLSIAQIDATDIKLVIDEYHFILLDWGFRCELLHKMLQYVKDWKNIIFVSATPIRNMYLPDELINYPTIKLNWTGYTQKEIAVVSGNDNDTVSLEDIIRCRIKSNSTCNLYIFCNSVKWICGIIRKLKLTPEITKVVCSESNADNKSKLKNIGFGISNLDDKDCNDNYYPINFVTSTAFAGVDCYDTNCRTYIISNLNCESTLIDISIEAKQILGRFRTCSTSHVPVHYISYGENFEKNLLEHRFSCNLNTLNQKTSSHS
jgi:hypothetical protein